MGSSTHRRTASARTKAAAASGAGGAVFALTGTARAAATGAAYTRTSDWTGGYTGQPVVTNGTDQVLTDWTLEFELPTGTRIGSLWNGEHTVKGDRVTAEPASWDEGPAPGTSVTVGFVTSATGTAGDPGSCLINDVACSVAGGATPTPGGRPTGTPTAASVPTASASPGATAPTPTPTPAAIGRPGGGGETGARFAPYVDISLHPAYDLLDTATRAGAKKFHLAYELTRVDFDMEGAARVVAFAQEKGVGRLAMWSGTRDKACPGGPKPAADATCSSVEQEPLAFTKAFAAYR